MPAIEAGVLVDGEHRQVCVHDQHGHLHCLQQILETEKQCPVCKVAFVSAVAAPDAVCRVGDVVDRQTVQTGWDDDMEKQAEALYLKIQASEAALSQKLSAIAGEERKKLKAVEAEESADLKKRIASLSEITAADKTVEKQCSSAAASAIKAERKKLERIAKEVAGHADRRRAAEEALELKVGTLEKRTAEQIAVWRGAHETAMEKLKEVSDGLGNKRAN